VKRRGQPGRKKRTEGGERPDGRRATNSFRSSGEKASHLGQQQPLRLGRKIIQGLEKIGRRRPFPGRGMGNCEEDGTSREGGGFPTGRERGAVLENRRVAFLKVNN